MRSLLESKKLVDAALHISPALRTPPVITQSRRLTYQSFKNPLALSGTPPLFLNPQRSLSSIPKKPESLILEAAKKDQIDYLKMFVDGIEKGEFPPEIAEITFDAFIKLVGATVNSAAALPIMVPLMRLMLGARNKQPYSVSIEKLGKTRLKFLAEDGILMLKRRVLASILPAILTQTVGLSGLNAMSVNSSIETIISGIPKSTKSEPYQRFKSIHGSTFGFLGSDVNIATLTKAQYDAALKAAAQEPLSHYRVIDESIFDFIRPDVNLATITEAQYKDEVEIARQAGLEVPQEATYAAIRLSYKRLQVLQKNFCDNIPYQTTLLAMRNAAFASGIFMAKSGAIEFVENAGEMLKAIGLEDEKTAIEVVSFAMRIFFAISTAPIDNALTKLSSGEISFSDFRQMEFSEQFSFRGAVARTAFVLCAFFTIVYGQEAGEFILENIKESALFTKTLEAMSKGIEKYQQFIDPQMEGKSVELIKFLLEDGDGKTLEQLLDVFSKIANYINENPALSIGIGREDANILVPKPSTTPSQPQNARSKVDDLSKTK